MRPLWLKHYQCFSPSLECQKGLLINELFPFALHQNRLPAAAVVVVNGFRHRRCSLFVVNNTESGYYYSLKVVPELKAKTKPKNKGLNLVKGREHGTSPRH